MPQIHSVFPTIASGDLISDTVALIGTRVLGLWAPTIDSCQAFLQGAFDTTSANFVRMSNPVGSGDFTWEVTVGSKGITISDALSGFPQARVELSAAQTDVRTFVMIAKI